MYKILFHYFGGKEPLTRDIYNIIGNSLIYDNNGKLTDKIHCFVDVFGGAGTVLLNIPREWKLDNLVYNDIDSNLYNLIKSLNMEGERKKMREQFESTLRSRELYNEIVAKYKNGDMLSAFEMLYLISNSFSGSIESGFGISRANTKTNTYTLNFNNALSNYKYMINWTIENLDFRKLIARYDRDTTFFYLDPPYVYSHRKYKPLFSIEDLKDLSILLKGIKGYWLLNESEHSFGIVSKYFGEPDTIIEYANMIRLASNDNGPKTRKEGYWYNFKKRDTKTANIDMFKGTDNDGA